MGTGLNHRCLSQSHPWGLVGFHSRSFSGDAKTGYLYNGHDDVMPYQMILTSDVFLHRNYIRLFTETIPRPILKEVDSAMNCEDLAMNFLVSHYCNCAGAFHVKTKKPVTPLKSDPSHARHARLDNYKQRSGCLNSFAKYYPTFPLHSNWCTY
jgi:alpha-1,4-N-acetylglucosaminyltransferase EXTL2